jgi:hypothetical protein
MNDEDHRRPIESIMLSSGVGIALLLILWGVLSLIAVLV